jgi:hypothetical protein
MTLSFTTRRRFSPAHQAKPPAPPGQVPCLHWWGRRFRLPIFYNS